MNEEGNTNNNVYNSIDKRIQRVTFNDDMDAKYGFMRYKSLNEKIGWLVNMQSVIRLKYHQIIVIKQNLF
jgi:hypothetical protein